MKEYSPKELIMLSFNPFFSDQKNLRWVRNEISFEINAIYKIRSIYKNEI